jgi:glycosyltransferase involved in cell wall biosynthesis
MKIDPVVSVIIPTFNRSHLLEETLNSVLAQSFKDFEIIVVDDASTDGTQILLNKFSSLQTIVLDVNQGVSYARNRGIEVAKGRYICFLDSDDLWEPKKLEIQTQWMEEHIEFAACQTEEIWIRNGVRVNPGEKHKKYSGDIFLQSLPLCIVSPSSVMIRTNILKETGGFDTKLLACEDYDLWLRMSSKFSFGYINQNLLIKYGGHEDQLSRKYWGMDRFRVYSLSKLLSLESLSKEQTGSVLDVLIKKCEILLKGFEKREKLKEVDIYKKHLKLLKSLDKIPIGSTEKESILENLDALLLTRDLNR